MRYDPWMAQETDGRNRVEPTPPVLSPELEDASPEGFDEGAYLKAYPDVAAAVRAGHWASALEHYRVHGERENRLADKRYISAITLGSTANFHPCCADRILISPGGHCLVSGWILDSETAPLRQIVMRHEDKLVGATESIARHRRDDLDTASTTAEDSLPGFWSVMELEQPIDASHEVQITLVAGDGRQTFTLRPAEVSEKTLRDSALHDLVNAQYYGDHEIETMFQLDSGVGKSIIDLNVGIVRRIAQGAWQGRFGIRRARWLGSVVVVLYGHPEYLTLQSALFSECPGFDQYEYIFVSNSPELSDTLVRDATNASRIYGISITLILLPGNTSFGVANNLGAAAADSGRILFVNPDVLPREPAWPRLHAELVNSLPQDQTALFGVPLYYDDGSLMHGGMYIDVYGGCSIRNGRLVRRDILRVEHYGKGAPAGAPQYVTARPLPGVTGAFMSMDRAWFERLGGFSPEYIFVYYEDVDLCLKSLQAGKPPWLHNIPFWHLETKGSKRTPLHVASRLVNRWRLTDKWGDLVKTELNGRSPARFAAAGQT